MIRKILISILFANFAFSLSAMDINEQLIESVKNNNIIKAQKLINLGAYVNAIGRDGNSPLFHAVIMGFQHIAELLISNHANVNFKSHGLGRPLITCAVINNRKNIAKLLLDNNANVDAGDCDGDTALFIAVICNFRPIVELLLSYNANIDAKNQRKQTPLSNSAININVEIANLLISRGADFNCKDIFGNTAFHWAALWNNKNIIKLLLIYNAYKDLKNNEGKRAIDLTTSEEIKDLINNHMYVNKR